VPRRAVHPGLSILHANGDAVIAQDSHAGYVLQDSGNSAFARTGVTREEVAVAKRVDQAARMKLRSSSAREEADEQDLVQG